MTVAQATPAVPGRAAARTSAPLGRQLLSELRWIIRRPRTLFGLGALALIPVVAGVGLWFAADGPGPAGAGIAAIISGNGLVLPVFVLLMTLPVLLPLVGAIWAADGIAGEAQHGTLRGLLLSPVGRLRLLGIKAFGVAVMSLLSVTVIAVVGAVVGAVLFGGQGMLTLSGSSLPLGPALGRIALVVLLVSVQVWAVAAVALAVSTTTEHPLVVMATTLAGLIVFGLLMVFDSLSWLHPYLLSYSWSGLADVIRDPLPTGQLWESTALAGCYILIGLSLAAMRLVTKDH